MVSDLEKEAINVNKQGDSMFKKKNYNEAISLYIESVKLMKLAGNTKKAQNYSEELEKAVAKRAAEINDEGDKLFKGKDYKAAIDVYQKAWDMIEKTGDKWKNKYGKEFKKELNKAKVKYAKEILQLEAESFVDAKKWEDAISSYKVIINMIDPNTDEKLNKSLIHDMKTVYERWGQEVNNIGDDLYRNKKFEEAIEKYAESVKLIKKSDNEKKMKDFVKELGKAFSEHAQEVNNVGDKLMKQKDYMKAAEFYRSSVDLAKEAGNSKLENNFTKELNSAYEKYAKEINEKGDKLYKEGKYEEAARVYEESVSAARDGKQTKLISNFSKEFEKACEKWADQVNKQGDAKTKAKKWDDAIKFYTLSVDIISKTKDEKKIANYNKELQKSYAELAKEINAEGDKLYKAKKFDEAYEIYDKSVKLAEKSGDQGKIRNYQKERNKALDKSNK